MYNSSIQTFPSNMIASMLNFEKCELFKIDTAEKIVPDISFAEETIV